MSEQKTDSSLYSDAASAKTAMKNAKPNSELLEFFGDYDDSMYILDFGAGHGRHATVLREMGHKVYAYDPFNGSEDEQHMSTGPHLPKGSQDVRRDGGEPSWATNANT